jgi:dihydropyrimidine dehydrogenase (NAD+) subunit PreA
MANLEVDFAGVPFRNPLVLASATPGWDGLRLKEAGDAGFAAVIPKTIGPVQEWAAHPRNGRLSLYRVGQAKRPIGMVNVELFTTKSRDDWVTRELEIAREGGAKIFASILAMPDPGDTAELAQQVESCGQADLFELNVSCPMPDAGVGMHIGKDPDLTAAQVAAVKAATSLPLSVKLTPNVSSMVDIAQASVDAGVDAVTISNSIRSFAGVDIETGVPYLRAYGGYTGPAIKPVIMRHVSEVARAVDVPIAAVGGVSSWRDVVEYVMLGASCVELCTVVMWEGLGFIDAMLTGLAEFMDRKNYPDLESFRGMALSHITTTDELAKEPPKFVRVDDGLCSVCDICSRVCFYGAIAKTDGGIETSRELCDGCGLCVEWCPKDALSLEV